jgi:polysaccharide biosynthesis transport protein
MSMQTLVFGTINSFTPVSRKRPAVPLLSRQLKIERDYLQTQTSHEASTVGRARVPPMTVMPSLRRAFASQALRPSASFPKVEISAARLLRTIQGFCSWTALQDFASFAKTFTVDKACKRRPPSRIEFVKNVEKAFMVDELQEEAGERLDLQHYIGVIRRRQLVFLIPFFLGWLLVWSAGWVLPARYKWGTQIRVPASSNVNDDPQGRLQSITQQILNSTPLLHIVDELNLYSEDRGRLTPDELAEHMRNDIKIEEVHGDERQITSVNIYYSAHDPYIARRVTGELTNLFISEDESMRLRESEDQTSFLEGQLKTSRQNLVEQEQRVRALKDQHPELGSNVQILTGLLSELRNQEEALKAAQQRHAYLTAQASRTKTGSDSPSKLLVLEQELEKLRARCYELRLSGHKDKYPEVRTLTEQINQKEKALADLKSATVGPSAATQPDFDSREMANREREISALKAKINDYQKLLKQGPALEQQLAELTRGYDQSKANYDDVWKKRIASERITEQLKRHQGELLRTIDLSRLPLKPDFPNRIKLCGIGLGFGLLLGTLLAGAAEYLDDRLYGEEGLKNLLPVSAITKIPAITTHEEKRRQQRKLWLTWALTGFVFATILAGSAISFLRS